VSRVLVFADHEAILKIQLPSASLSFERLYEQSIPHHLGEEIELPALFTMFTPPNPATAATQPAFSPLATTSRHRQLPARSSLSNSFSFAPPPDISDSESSFSLAFAREPNAVDQGNRGMGQVSPRVRPSPSSSKTMMPARAKSRLAEEVNGNDEEEDEGRTWDMVDSMRLWRHDAIMQHLYETATFWGDKILSWTGECAR